MQNRIDVSKLDSSEMKSVLSVVRKAKKPVFLDSGGNRVPLPAALNRFLAEVLEQIDQGHSIVVMQEDKTFTTQAAAKFLGVSRQYFVNLLEKGLIPFHKAGSHRRVYFKDLNEFAENRNLNRRETLDSLFDKVHSAGKYDNSYTG